MNEPQQLGPYRIVRRLGRGGMGTVYEAVHVVTNEPAAVKTLSESLIEEPDFRARFELEIETLRKLNHPNIVRLIGFGEEQGILFYVMELVHGPSLDQELRAGRKFHWQEVAEIGVQICRALRHAHDRGIIHRDLKPANLLRAENGTIKLSDFGIARLFGAPSHTGVGSILGTIEYMAPEQAESLPIGPRADLYSLGAVLYALLVGRPPFKVTSFAEILHLHRTSQPAPVRSFVPDCPEELDRIIRELLAKDPDKRIANALLAGRRLQAMLHALTKHKVAGSEDVLHATPGHLIDFGVEQGDRRSVPVDGEAPTAALPSSPEPPRPSLGETITAAGSPSESPENQAAAFPVGTPSMWKPTRETDVFRYLEKESPVPDHPEDGLGSTATAEPKEQKGRTEQPSPPVTSSATQTTRKFVEVPPEELDKIEPSPSERQPIFSLQTGILLAALVVLAITIWYFLQPPTADQLYNRVMAKVGDGTDSEALLSAAPDIEAFLTRYPEDARAPSIREYQQEIDLLRLERRFELQSRQKASAHSSIPIERDYLQALRYAQLDPELGIEKLEALLALYDYAPTEKLPADKSRETAQGKSRRPVGHTAECLELARRRLEQLKKQLAPAITNQRDLIAGRLEEANQLEATDPEKADAIRRAIIVLYGDKGWAKPYIEQAEAALQRRSQKSLPSQISTTSP
ncbi:MAG TPA: serine/threonine-protein kinase [Thermogutta sp.]|nr:serine/threonine-protein kinase [Thermogutta sp.]HQF12391.1 serine/threonine-protein kinase [Thermogutta sp.]